MNKNTEEYNLQKLEKQTILACVKWHSGNISKAVKSLNISRATFYVRMKKYKNVEPANEKVTDFNLINLEKITIAKCLYRNYGNMKISARHLGISKSTLWRKIKEYNIEYIQKTLFERSITIDGGLLKNGELIYPQKQKVLVL